MLVRNTFQEQLPAIEPWYVGNILPGITAEVLVTPLEDETVFIDLSTQSVMHKIAGDGEPVTAVAVTPDGTMAAIVLQSQQLQIVEVASARVVASTRMPSPIYIAVADARLLLFAFGGSDGTVTVWDIAGGYITHSLKGHGTTVSLVVFNNGDALNFLLALGDIMGTVKVWDLVARKAIHSISDHTGAVRGLGFLGNPDVPLVLGGRDEVVILYNDRYRPAMVVPVNECIESCGFTLYDGEPCFYTAGANNQLKIRSVLTKELRVSSPSPHETLEELQIIAVTELDETFVAVLSDQTLTFLNNESLEVEQMLAGNHGIIADMRAIGSDLVLATNSPAIRIVSTNSPMSVQLLEGHTDLLNGIDVLPDGKWLVSAGKDGAAIVWHFSDDSWQQHLRYTGHVGAVAAVAFNRLTPVPKWLVTAGADLTIKKWLVKPGDRTLAVYTRRAHDKEINALDVAPNDEFFATALYDKTAKVWDAEVGELTAVLKGHKRGLWDVRFCPYDRHLATASGDKTAKVWLLHNYQCTATLEGHTNSVQRVTWFNRDSPQVATSGADGLVKVWANGEEVCTLDGHENRIWALTSLDDTPAVLVTGDADGKIVTWIDYTDEAAREAAEAQKKRVEDIQKLELLVGAGDWTNAFLMALALGHLMRLYEVVNNIISQHDDDEVIDVLQQVIGVIDDAQMVQLLKKLRDWNTNFRHFEAAQQVLSVILTLKRVEQLHKVPQLILLLDQIVPYNERHYHRLDDLVEESYILDYCVQEMAK